MDPIELSIFSARLNAICDEMGAVLRRTAFSPNIKDRLDFSCAIFDATGKLCAQAAHIPVHLGSMTHAMQQIVASRAWQAGDMVVLNDPYQGGTHLPDVTLIAPVFMSGNIIGFVANRAHHADIGCESPGSMPLSQTLDEEGILIPPSKLVIGDELQETILDPILDQLIDPLTARGDFLAQISANRCGIQRFTHLASTLPDLQNALDALNRYAEQAALRLIQSLPTGKYSFTDYLDDDGAGNCDLTLNVSINITPSSIHIDFTNSCKQTTGNVNCPLSVTAAAVYYVFYSLMPDAIPACDGCFRPITLTVPEASLLNARAPAAVAAGNVETSTRIVDCLLGALKQAIPDRIPAASHGSMNNLAMGTHSWAYYETMGGGMGAHSDADGQSAVQTHMTNSLNTPIEVMEMHYPLRISHYAIRTDSGGMGYHTGGDGIIREFTFLQAASVTLLTDRRLGVAWGSQPSNDGKAGVNTLNGAHLPAKCMVTVNMYDRLCVATPGGGGWSA